MIAIGTGLNRDERDLLAAFARRRADTFIDAEHPDAPDRYREYVAERIEIAAMEYGVECVKVEPYVEWLREHEETDAAELDADRRCVA